MKVTLSTGTNADRLTVSYWLPGEDEIANCFGYVFGQLPRPAPMTRWERARAWMRRRRYSRELR